MTDRRQLLAGIIALPVAAAPVLAAAPVDADARLADMERQLRAAHGPLVELYDKANDLACWWADNPLPKPDMLKVTQYDYDKHLTFKCSEFHSVENVSRLRTLPPDDVRHVRIQEIVSAWHAWEEECEAAEQASGLGDLDAKCSEYFVRFERLVTAMTALRPDTVAGIATKVRVANFVRDCRVTSIEDWKGLHAAALADVLALAGGQS